jgi:transposase
MAVKRRAYSAEFKRHAVQLVISGKKSRSQIARELGVRHDLLYRWQKELAPQTITGSEPENASAADVRIHELEREVATLREEREILKKAAAFFAKEGH